MTSRREEIKVENASIQKTRIALPVGAGEVISAGAIQVYSNGKLLPTTEYTVEENVVVLAEQNHTGATTYIVLY